MAPLPLTILVASLAMGTTITLSSHHWIMAWLGLEINTLAVIPLMLEAPHPRAIEAATKYFLTQAAASAIVLFMVLVNAQFTGEWAIPLTNDNVALPMSIALFMKLGLAPLHFWLPEVMQGIPLLPGLILSTWQKIAPLYILTQMSQSLNLSLMLVVGLTSILVGGWGGMNQTQLRKIMAYSSIGHLGWFIIILKFDHKLAMLNLIVYIIVTTAIFLQLMFTSSTTIATLSTMWSKSAPAATSTMLVLLSMGGLPLLSGFTPKFLILKELVKYEMYFLAFLMLLFALYSLFFYIRLSYFLSLIMPPNPAHAPLWWRLSNKSSYLSGPATALALLLLPITPVLLMISW
uniref:NADH-ubiquinone oxidoreductase chain 2 n=1 Tax=Cardioglossa leucomystax TaxID=111122 RepID=S4V0F8_9NEOB|nr:NADH dehydrogenase subunit 2 [Cardioglossa leucomystax]